MECRGEECAQTKIICISSCLAMRQYPLVACLISTCCSLLSFIVSWCWHAGTENSSWEGWIVSGFNLYAVSKVPPVPRYYSSPLSSPSLPTSAIRASPHRSWKLPHRIREQLLCLDRQPLLFWSSTPHHLRDCGVHHHSCRHRWGLLPAQVRPVLGE